MARSASGRVPYAPLRPALVRVEVQHLDAGHEAVGYGPHSHLFFEIVVFTSGGGEHFVAGVSQPVRAGQVWLLRPGVVHDLAPIGSATGRVVVVDAEALGLPPGLVDVLPWPAHALVAPFQHVDGAGRPRPVQLSAAALRRWTTYLDQMQQEAAEGRPGYDHAVQALLRLLLVDAARTTDPVGAPGSEPLVEQALRIVDDQFRGPLTLSVIAGQLAITPGHLTELVRQRTGRPLGQWILQRRMVEARVLLAETRRPVAAVSAECGFADVAHFSRQFRKVHGASPSAWRSAVLDRPQPSGSTADSGEGERAAVSRSAR